MADTIALAVFGALMAFINAWALWRLKRKARLDDNIHLRQDQLEHRMTANENACGLCRQALLTEEKLRRILQEFFDQFELRLINEGRLEPKQHRRKGQNDN